MIIRALLIVLLTSLSVLAEGRYEYVFVPVSATDAEIEKVTAWIVDATVWTVETEEGPVVRRHRQMTAKEFRELPVVELKGVKHYRLCIDVTRPCGVVPALSVDVSKLDGCAKAVRANDKISAETVLDKNGYTKVPEPED